MSLKRNKQDQDIKQAYHRGRTNVISECISKLDNLESKFNTLYGEETPEMYQGIYKDFREWLRKLSHE